MFIHTERYLWKMPIKVWNPIKYYTELEIYWGTLGKHYTPAENSSVFVTDDKHPASADHTYILHLP